MSNTISKNRLNAFKKQNGRCYYCGAIMWMKDKKEFATKYTISLPEAEKFKCTAEHLVARCDGGNNRKNNIVAACHFCNRNRHRRKNALNSSDYQKHVRGRLSKGAWHQKSQHHLTSPVNAS